MKRLVALCPTYNRRDYLPNLIESFQRQDYPIGSRRLIVLDDAGQYCSQEGQGWKIVSVRERFKSLGEKRNRLVEIAGPADGYLVADDDEVYLPNWFSCHARALAQAELSVPSAVFVDVGTGLKRIGNRFSWHAGWAYTPAAFHKAGGYRAISAGEDFDLRQRFTAAGVAKVDSLHGDQKPFLISRRPPGTYSLSMESEQRPGDTAYALIPADPVVNPPPIVPYWEVDWDNQPVLPR